MNTISYISDCLCFVAVPAALFEMLASERRARIDSYLEQCFMKLPSLCLKMLILLWIAIGCCALVSSHPVVTASILVFGLSIAGLAAVGTGALRVVMVLVVINSGFAVLAGVGMAAFHFMKNGSTIDTLLLYDNLNRWLADHAVVFDWLFPDFDGGASWENLGALSAVAEEQRESSGILTNLTHHWYWVSIEWAKGISFLGILVLDAFTVAIVLSLSSLVVAFCGHCFFLLSRYAQRGWQFESSTRFPVGATLIWGLGECVGFLHSTYGFFVA